MSSNSAYRAMPVRSIICALRAEVAFDRPPIAGQAILILLAERGDFHAANLLIGQVMGHAHETDASNTDANHWRDQGLGIGGQG